jgi:hypothetical protein
LNSLQPEHVLPLKAPTAQTKIGERRGSEKKRNNKIVAGSHSHYFIYHHNVLCFMPLSKLWERHLAAINEHFEPS